MAPDARVEAATKAVNQIRVLRPSGEDIARAALATADGVPVEIVVSDDRLWVAAHTYEEFVANVDDEYGGITWQDRVEAMRAAITAALGVKP